jgi:hypothetical protein
MCRSLGDIAGSGQFRQAKKQTARRKEIMQCRHDGNTAGNNSPDHIIGEVPMVMNVGDIGSKVLEDLLKNRGEVSIEREHRISVAWTSHVASDGKIPQQFFVHGCNGTNSL